MFVITRKTLRGGGGAGKARSNKFGNFSATVSGTFLMADETVVTRAGLAGAVQGAATSLNVKYISANSFGRVRHQNGPGA